ALGRLGERAGGAADRASRATARCPRGDQRRRLDVLADADLTRQLARDRVVGAADSHRDRPVERRRLAHLQAASGDELQLRQGPKQISIAVRDALDRRPGAWLECRERSENGTLELEVRAGDGIAMRVPGRKAECAVDVRLELLGKRVLQPVCLHVDGGERQYEGLDEVVTDEAAVACAL